MTLAGIAGKTSPRSRKPWVDLNEAASTRGYIPSNQGIYRIRLRRGKGLLYIGISGRLAKRLQGCALPSMSRTITATTRGAAYHERAGRPSRCLGLFVIPSKSGTSSVRRSTLSPRTGGSWVRARAANSLAASDRRAVIALH